VEPSFVTDDIARIKWHSVDQVAAQRIIALTNSSGIVYGLDTNALPVQMKKLPDVCSYFVSAYTNSRLR
jgi:hypothetical protein